MDLSLALALFRLVSDWDLLRVSARTSSSLTLACEYGASEVSRISTNLEEVMVEVNVEFVVMLALMVMDVARVPVDRSCSSSHSTREVWKRMDQERPRRAIDIILM